MLFAPREEIGERGEPWCDDVKERAFAFMLRFFNLVILNILGFKKNVSVQPFGSFGSFGKNSKKNVSCPAFDSPHLQTLYTRGM